MNKMLKDLNKAQTEAVLHLDGALLVLAGAGSGKTRMLTSRLAYLIDCVGIPAESTLTLTFTNKAANEMRNRAFDLIRNKSLSQPLLCTFHKFGLLFLKFHIGLLNRKVNFVLLDSDDKKKILRNFNANIQSGILNSEISRMKNWLISPEIAREQAQDDYHKEIARIYGLYDEYLRDKNMLDFDDLLLLSYEILDKFSDVCEQTSKKYNYIMVDEYQDTNEIQHKLLKKLCLTHNNICAVGDENQSIYGWRGANINNILDFAKNFENAKIIKLEQNYRSTSQILEAANKLISFNANQLGKELKSTLGDGEDVKILESLDERIESQSIAKEIRKLLDNGENPSEIAILFRLNALSRSIEEGLNKENVAYKLIGAVRFYERAEIKDILSYFRLVINPHDDFSFLRIINRPKRGIGKVTQDKLEEFAKSKKTSIFGAINEFKSEIPLASKHIAAISGIFDLLQELRDELENSTMGFLEAFKQKVNILDTFGSIQDDIDREANIDEFYGFFRDYVINHPTDSLEDFLNDISLTSASDDSGINCVSCMSVHSAKGLEFKHVFVIGLEEGFFPIISDTTDIEEERRLGYVAITRAKRNLVLCFVHSRYHKGKRALLSKSRFLSECGLCEGRIELSKPNGFRKNDLVIHKIFGAGRIMEVSGSGRDMKLKINFGGSIRDILSSFVTKA